MLEREQGKRGAQNNKLKTKLDDGVLCLVFWLLRLVCELLCATKHGVHTRKSKKKRPTSL